MKYKWFIILILLVSSCAPVYRSTTFNTPMFDNKGDADVKLGTGTAGVELQGGIAVSDNFAITANFGSFNFESDSTDYFKKHRIVEVGGGYYSNNEGTLQYGVYSGYGYARVQALDMTFFGYEDQWLKGSYHKLYIQPFIGFKANNIIELITSVRLTNVVYYDMETLNLDYNFNEGIHDVFAEPAIQMRIYGGDFFFYGQGSLSLPVGSEAEFDYKMVFMSFGFGYRFGSSK